MSRTPDPLQPAPAGGALEPLRQPAFRMLWAAGLAANTCLWMNDVAAAWLMTTLATSPVQVALVSSASTLPMFLFGLASGALADIVDRRRYLITTQFWVAVVAVLSAMTVASGRMNATLLLVLTFANGLGLAMRMPVFAAIVPTLVPKTQLPAALALNGVGMNASRIIGPTLAGLVIAAAGSVWVFVLNAVISVVTGISVLRWKTVPGKVSALPAERFVGAIRVGLQYVGQSAHMRNVILRTVLFFAQSSALMALLPLLARRLHGGGPGSFTALLAAMGAGAIASALWMPRLRARWKTAALVRIGTLVHAGCAALMTLAPNVFVALPLMAVAGMAWLGVANALAVSAQSSLPDWVRARGMSIYQMSLMGSSALGAALWGQVASFTSVTTAVVAGALTGVAMSTLAARLRPLADEHPVDLTPQRAFEPPTAAVPIDAGSGPVLVTIEYFVEPARIDEFKAVMRESRRSRLRHGAIAWELFRDSADPTRWIEYFIDETWVEHLRRFDRVTAAEVALRDRRHAFHARELPPRVQRFIAEPVDR